MEFITIKENCYYFSSAVNMGYITSEDQRSGMLIDAGLEAASAKKVLRVLEENKLPLTHLFITHAHADHFGGAQYIQKKYDVHTIAPSLEEAIMKYPILEPIYLLHGSIPLNEMRNKFLEAPAIRIDEICQKGKWNDSNLNVEFIPLPGHSYNQFGMIYNDICYAADAFLGDEALLKHKIPFIVDSETNRMTLEYLFDLKVEGMIPGHGSYSESYKDIILANLEIHSMVESQILNIILTKRDRGLSLEDLVAEMLNKQEIKPNNLGSYSLFRTTITAYLIHLIHEKRAVYTIKEGRPVIYSGQSSA
ncbi:MBL fold metallo-hydrolase [Fictibacillus barbaricus]|uniref:Glyoxylase-like metal-dependent hydrolase (Beta-lactamase superfamily II) n=1 Tax=Fictibacillus barbaricus TaxID=182136 RepID=A0ABU1TXX1_9BACL|nr:MBL fold metallo-hydrolase [Fictibacillus barbaricus]MDR7072060.1 glyoxylase-like metal-dependent hydrolase (beta-lactamase superfamily II) [Fictibacillus barbaricus]